MDVSIKAEGHRFDRNTQAEGGKDLEIREFVFRIVMLIVVSVIGGCIGGLLGMWILGKL